MYSQHAGPLPRNYRNPILQEHSDSGWIAGISRSSCGGGGGLLLFGDFLISHNTITSNTGSGLTGQGGSLQIGVADSGAHTIENTIITRNFVTDSSGGGGIDAFAFVAGTLTLDHAYVVENLAGGGLHVSGAGVTLQL